MTTWLKPKKWGYRCWSNKIRSLYKSMMWEIVYQKEGISIKVKIRCLTSLLKRSIPHRVGIWLKWNEGILFQRIVDPILGTQGLSKWAEISHCTTKGVRISTNIFQISGRISYRGKLMIMTLVDIELKLLVGFHQWDRSKVNQFESKMSVNSTIKELDR